MEDDLDTIIPDSSNRPYDMKKVLKMVVDNGDIYESQKLYARNMITCFARMNGSSVGIIANQPRALAGCLDIDASVKAGRFVRFCDTFNIPLIALVDVPGFMPGPDQECGGIIRHGAKLLFAFTEATVPRISVIVRKAYGGAYLVMNSKHIHCDVNYAWPTAEIAVMGPKGAAEVIHRKEIQSADNPEAVLNEKMISYRQTFVNPFLAAHRGYVDDVIFPRDTRHRLIRTLQMLEGKDTKGPERKYGNIPL